MAGETLMVAEGRKVIESVVRVLRRRIGDARTRTLLDEIIASFAAARPVSELHLRPDGKDRQ